MPEISRFFGIIVRMYYSEHNPPHLHTEYQGSRASFDFSGNIIEGGLNSKTAVRLVREWIDLHTGELSENWQLAQKHKAPNKIVPLD